ncbi:TPA: hypothetical protein ACH3X3_007248 [Trebouxia sp. C0006]
MYMVQPSISTLYARQLCQQAIIKLCTCWEQHAIPILHCQTTSAPTAELNMGQGDVSSESIANSFLSKWKGKCMVPASRTRSPFIDGQNHFCPSHSAYQIPQSKAAASG